jgi:potassium efflux system protein
MLLRAKRALTRHLADVEQQREELTEDLDLVRQRVELAGLNETLALVLRQQRDALPSEAKHRRVTGMVEKETRWATGLQIDTEKTRRDFIDTNSEARRIIGLMEPPPPDSIADFLLPRVESVLRQQKELANGLHEASGRYIRQLGRLDNANRTLLLQAESFNLFISEHLLWIRSAPALSLKSLRESLAAVVLLLAPERWVSVFDATVASFTTDPMAWTLVFAAVALTFLFRGRARRTLLEAASHVGKARRDSIWHAVRALAASIYFASTWPLIPAAIGYQLSVLEAPLPRAIGHGLLVLQNSPSKVIDERLGAKQS